MLKSFSLSLALVIPIIAAAQSPVRRDSVAPGLFHSRYQTSVPHVVNVLSFDRSQNRYLLEAYRPNGLVKTSLQVLENERAGVNVVAAINADFFIFQTGRPVGNQVRNGMFVSGIKSSRSHLGIEGDSRPFIEILSFAGTVAWPGTIITIDRVNHVRGAGMNVLYNLYWGNELKPDSLGIKVKVRLIDAWRVADTLRAVVVNDRRNAWRMEDSSRAVFVFERIALKGNLPEEGDTVKLLLGFEGDRRSYSQVLGGGGRILGNGKIVREGVGEQEGIREKFFADRHPRTFVGFDRDTTSIFLCTVDGRQESSVGMTFREMGEFLLEIEAWNALNLDGGGSSTMVIDGAVVNAPSDATGERPAANSLQLISKKVIDHSSEQGHEN